MSRAGYQILAFLFCALTVAIAPSVARAQLGIQLHGGGIQPLSATVHNTVRWETEIHADDEGVIPNLVNLYSRFGFQGGVLLLFNQVEVRYALAFLGWDHVETTCQGLALADRLAGGDLDDSAVTYSCLPEPDSEQFTVGGLEPIYLHTLTFGYRIPLFHLTDRLNAYAVVAPGLAINTYIDNQPEAGLLFGILATGGAGLEFAITDLFSVVLDGRYNLVITTPTTSYQSAVNRSVVLGESTASALFDGFHFLTCMLGFQMNVR